MLLPSRVVGIFYAEGGVTMTEQSRHAGARLRTAVPEVPRRYPSFGQVFFCLMSTFCFVLILRNPDVAIEYMGRGLSLCARTVIPLSLIHI